MPKAISYIRFSSTIQKQGDSLRRQNELIESWLSSNPTVKFSDLQFKDLGKSGYHGKHLEHGFGQLLAAINEGFINKGDILLVEAIDRLGRLEPSVMMELLMGIVNAGVTIITLEDNISYDKNAMREGGIYILSGKIQGAHAHSDKLSNRIKASWKNKRQQATNGKGVNRKSFWYITKGATDKYDTITTQDKALVNKIFTEYLNGKSQNEIVAFLKEQDPIRFKTYSPTALKKMLTNKTAIGYWEDTPNAYESSIEESLFYSVQKAIEQRKGTKSQGTKTKHIMSGLVTCKRCGKNYSIRNQKHSATVMYCAGANKKNCDNTTVIPLAIFNEFRTRTQIGYIEAIIKNSYKNDNQKLVVALDGKIGTISKSIENLVDLVATGSSFAMKKVTSLEVELEELQNERNNLVAEETTAINIDNLKQAGLDMASDPVGFNLLLKNTGYKIIAEDKTLTLGSDHMEYIKYVKSGAATGKYEVSCHGQIEHIAKLEDQSKSQIEQVNTLIKQLNK